MQSPLIATDVNYGVAVVVPLARLYIVSLIATDDVSPLYLRHLSVRWSIQKDMRSNSHVR